MHQLHHEQYAHALSKFAAYHSTLSVYNAVQKLMRKTTNFNGNSHFLGIRKVLNLSLKAEIQLQKENNTEDWALGSHPRDNGHVLIRPKILSLKS